MTATRFTFGLGPTDIFLAVSIIVIFLGAHLNRKSDSYIENGTNTDVKLVFQFWILTLILLTLSTAANTIYWGYNIQQSFGRYVPFLIAPAMIFSLTKLSRSDELFFSFLTAFVVSSLILGAIYAFFVITNNTAYYSDFRFVGFSDNPNQIASQSLATIVVGIQYWILLPRKTIHLKVMDLLMIVFALVYGVACVSDTFYLATAFLVALMGAFWFCRFFTKYMVLTLFSSFTFVLILAYFSTEIIDRFGIIAVAFQQAKSGTDDHDLVRFLLWDHGYQAGMASPLIGNGAGAWSGFNGPFGEIEAHNSFIDWFTIVGGLGVLILVQMIVRFVLNVRWPRLEPVICFSSLLLMSVFHFVFRHPFFWVAVFLCFYINGRFRASTARPTKTGRYLRKGVGN